MTTPRFPVRSAFGALALSALIGACDNSPQHPTTPSRFGGSAAYTLTGQVSHCGSPVSGASVVIHGGPDDGRYAVTDDAGKYSLSGVHTGVFSITVTASQTFGTTHTLSLVADQQLDFDIPCVPLANVVVTGVATDDDGLPVSGASIRIAAYVGNTSPEFTGETDGAGRYSIEVSARATDGSIKAEDASHDRYFDYLDFSARFGTVPTLTRDVRLYRITRINAGESTRVTIAPGDSLCGHDDELVCRRVTVMVPAAGSLTMGCEPQGNDNGGPGLTIVEYNGRAGVQPWHVTGGEVPVDIGMWGTSKVSQSCTLTTSFQAR